MSSWLSSQAAQNRKRPFFPPQAWGSAPHPFSSYFYLSQLRNCWSSKATCCSSFPFEYPKNCLFLLLLWQPPFLASVETTCCLALSPQDWQIRVCTCLL
ncbi:hypothetical protein DL98DRAFT_197041 [Cadophora sp. DSE1049]|nr:hypothetical protein DL98DRAFT_197041 [Cadophora sp. DSE1049]